LKHEASVSEAYECTSLVTYDDTPFFALDKISAKEYCFTPKSFVSVVVTDGEGCIVYQNSRVSAKKGDKFFIPYGIGEISLQNISALICYPPKTD
jgi:mannose-6-phosphate isomerase class I